MSLIRVDMLTESETEYLCRLVSPKEIKRYFQKKDKILAELKINHRAMKLTDQEATKLIVKYRNKNFVAEFLSPFINAYLKEVHDHIDSLKEAGIASDTALIRALVNSKVFSSYVELYFKLENEPVSDEYVSLINTAVSLLCERTTETTAQESSYAELSQSLDEIQRKLVDEREEHKHIQAKLVSDKLAVQDELDYAKDELAKAVSKIDRMQSELDHYEWLMKYADPPYENDDSDKYQHTSLCRVALHNSTGRTQLERLADIRNGELELFQMDKAVPPKFENRKWLYKKDGPSEIGSWGIWHWNAIPKDDPERDHIESTFDTWMAPVEVFVCRGCVTREDLINRLLTGIPLEISGAKMLISIPPLDDQYSGLLCSSDQFDVQNGTAKLKTSVFTLPLFQIHTSNTLSIVYNTSDKKIFCRSLTLGLPVEVVRVKNPFTLVKEIVLTRVKTNILQQQGLGVNEARRNGEFLRSFLRSVETSTLYDEVAESYGCPIEDAQKYVADFIELAEKSLSDSDISVDVLSAVIEKSTSLMSKCKDILSKEWSVENAEQLHVAQQTLDAVSKATEQQRQNMAALQTKQGDLQRQIETLQSKIDEKEALASAVEEKVAQRIAAAQQNAADFISDLAFITPVTTQSADTSGPVLSIFDRPVRATEISSTITKLSDFRRRLAENLEYSGYSEEYSAQLSKTLSFCVSQRLPVVCDSNAEIISDCLAAMFGLSGVRVIQIPTTGCCSGKLVDLLRQKSTNAPHVYLINGALDAYSPNIFNAILQDTYSLDRSILIFSSEGIPTEALPSPVWSRAMFVDGDTGLIRFPQNSIKAYETASNLRPELKADKLKEKQEQLEPFSVVISNRALLNYANFMATMDSSIQSDTCILTQILLSTKSDGRLEKLLELFEENEIDTEDARFSKYL